MTEAELTQKFLAELKAMTDGQAGEPASMYEVGESIGLEKNEASMIAEDLIVDGLAELVSLSGSISITSEGLKQLGDNQAAAGNDGETFILGREPYLDDDSCRRISGCIRNYRSVIEGAALGFDILEEIVLDMKTLEVQLISSRPKTSIVREVLKVLAEHAVTGELKEVHAEICSMLGD